MDNFYTDERNVQIVLALLKAHGIRKVIASPGATNVTIVASMQQDSFFEIYSSVDERSAAYIACGLAAESGEPVVLSCTGATASRNYIPGLTEAYYRKLPILAVTSTQVIAKVGHHIAQVIDRSNIQNDIAKLSLTLPIIKDNDDIWECEIKVNQAILELTRRGGGPVHLNLPTTYSRNYSVKELPKVRVINRIKITDQFPELPQGRIAVLVGSHAIWTREQTEALDRFCASNNAVVFCDHSSCYKGKYRLLFSLVAAQQLFTIAAYSPDLLIHIGEITGDYSNMGDRSKQVWRVNEDGEIRDTFRKLRYIFEMEESSFFEYYVNDKKNESYFLSCQTLLDEMRKKIPELPFSNIWIASQIAHRIPKGATVHLGILNSLRSWNFFEFPNSVLSASNVGGFGIDGGLSSLVGASFVDKNKLYFGVFGDLAFFYDMNVMGNRHINNNLRILLVNNGKGTEFRQYNHAAACFGDDADEYIAAAGHYGNKSKVLVKHYAEDLGFEYLSASSKQEFLQAYERFITSKSCEKSILFEIFTDSSEESYALKMVRNMEKSTLGMAKEITKKTLGAGGVSIIKKIIGK